MIQLIERTATDDDMKRFGPRNIEAVIRRLLFYDGLIKAKIDPVIDPGFPSIAFEVVRRLHQLHDDEIRKPYSIDYLLKACFRVEYYCSEQPSDA